jgi:hypothetical protein
MPKPYNKPRRRCKVITDLPRPPKPNWEQRTSKEAWAHVRARKKQEQRARKKEDRAVLQIEVQHARHLQATLSLIGLLDAGAIDPRGALERAVESLLFFFQICPEVWRGVSRLRQHAGAYDYDIALRRFQERYGPLAIPGVESFDNPLGRRLDDELVYTDEDGRVVDRDVNPEDL